MPAALEGHFTRGCGIEVERGHKLTSFLPSFASRVAFRPGPPEMVDFLLDAGYSDVMTFLKAAHAEAEVPRPLSDFAAEDPEPAPELPASPGKSELEDLQEVKEALKVRMVLVDTAAR